MKRRWERERGLPATPASTSRATWTPSSRREEARHGDRRWRGLEIWKTTRTEQGKTLEMTLWISPTLKFPRQIRMQTEMGDALIRTGDREEGDAAGLGVPAGPDRDLPQMSDVLQKLQQDAGAASPAERGYFRRKRKTRDTDRHDGEAGKRVGGLVDRQRDRDVSRGGDRRRPAPGGPRATGGRGRG